MERLAKQLTRMERKVKTQAEHLDTLSTMVDMKRVFATKQDFNTLAGGIGEAHYKLDRFIEDLGIEVPKTPDNPSGIVSVKAPRYRCS